MSKTDDITPSEGLDRSIYSRFIKWSKGDKAQMIAAMLLIFGSLVYQVWQEPSQLEFVKVIAVIFIAVAIIEEYFELKGKNVDLEKDKVMLERDKNNLFNAVNRVEKALQAEFLMNKNLFGSDITSLVLSKLEDYLDGDNLDKLVIKKFKEVIIGVQEKGRKYASLITHEFKDFLVDILQEREEAEIPIASFSKTLIVDKLTQSKESEFTENVEENNKAIDDFNKEFEEEET